MNNDKSLHKQLAPYIAFAQQNHGYEFECRLQGSDDDSIVANMLAYLASMSSVTTAVTLDVNLKGGIRHTVEGEDAIHGFCLSNRLPLPNTTTIRKSRLKDHPNVYSEEWGVVGKIKQEKTVKTVPIRGAPEMLFRYKKRRSFVMDKHPWLRVDITAVKSAAGTTVPASGLFDRPQSYEIEVEYLPEAAGVGADADEVYESMATVLMTLLKIRYQTNHVIPMSEKKTLLQWYMSLVFPKGRAVSAHEMLTNPKPYFAGPQPVTLELPNMVRNASSMAVSVLDGYSITEKADGERALLLVDKRGTVYMLNTRMHVKHVGTCASKSCWESVLDGEYVTRATDGSRLDMYLCFDAYFRAKRDVRASPLPERLQVAEEVIASVQPESAGFQVKRKQFEFVSGDKSLGECARVFFDRQDMGRYAYHIDGLILTPIDLGVYQQTKSQPVSSYDTIRGLSTWSHVFKWKPVEESSVDFLVRITGRTTDRVRMDLYVGRNAQDHEDVSFFDLMTGTMTKAMGKTVTEYKPYMYSSTSVPASDQGFAVCEDGSVIQDNTVIEFRWDFSREGGSWLPMRQRTDKTSMYRTTKSIGGAANDYRVAMNVWNSIQRPVTRDHLLQKTEVPATVADEMFEDEYYVNHASRGASRLLAMRNFHNIGIKNELIARHKAGALLDVACGRGGDISKWIRNGITTVVGFDSVTANIRQAYGRMLTTTARAGSYGKHSYAFATMDATQPWETQAKTADPVNKGVLGWLMGEAAPAGAPATPPAAAKPLHGVIKQGFDTISCQFAIHYFMKSKHAFTTFLKNIGGVSKPGTLFVGTCMDGATLHAAFESRGPELRGVSDGEVLWSINRRYESYPTPEDPYGHGVEVYVQSIGQRIDEYVVDFDTLVELMRAGGFDLQESMMFSSSIHPTKTELSPPEREYSFLNRWFVFRKSN